MINEGHVKRYCCEPLENIENYQEAISDMGNVWHCHHRAEILPCGRFHQSDLKKFGLFFKRPAHELIFLRKGEHRRLHMSGRFVSKETRTKLSVCNKGIKRSADFKRKISESLVGNQYCLGKHWNLTDEQKDKHRQSMIGKRNGWHHWTNGVENKFCEDCPGAGWWQGITRRST